VDDAVWEVPEYQVDAGGEQIGPAAGVSPVCSTNRI
jgi:hypothetical protein